MGTRCKDCKYFESWRTPEAAEKFGQIYECELGVITCPSPDDYCSKAEKVERHSNNNHWCDTCEYKHLESECLGCAEYDEYDNLVDLHNYKEQDHNELEYLSKRVEALEKQMKKDKEEKLKKLEAELEYAKYGSAVCCSLPTIIR